MILNLLLTAVPRLLVPVGMLKGRMHGRVDLDGEWTLWLLPPTSVDLFLVRSTIYPPDKELMTSPRLPDIGDTERLRSIPWYVLCGSILWQRLTGSIPISTPHHSPARPSAPLQPLNPSTLLLTPHTPYRIDRSNGLYCIQSLEGRARGIREVLATVHWGDCREVG